MMSLACISPWLWLVVSVSSYLWTYLDPAWESRLANSVIIVTCWLGRHIAAAWEWLTHWLQEGSNKEERHLFFSSTIKMMVKLWPHWHWWQNVKATGCLVWVELWTAFSLSERNRRNPAWSAIGEATGHFQKKCSLTVGSWPGYWAPAEVLCTSYSGLANVMHQDSCEVCSRPWMQNGQPEFWSLCRIQ